MERIDPHDKRPGRPFTLEETRRLLAILPQAEAAAAAAAAENSRWRRLVAWGREAFAWPRPLFIGGFAPTAAAALVWLSLAPQGVVPRLAAPTAVLGGPAVSAAADAIYESHQAVPITIEAPLFGRPEGRILLHRSDGWHARAFPLAAVGASWRYEAPLHELLGTAEPGRYEVAVLGGHPLRLPADGAVLAAAPGGARVWTFTLKTSPR